MPDAATSNPDAGFGGSLLPSTTSLCARAALGTSQDVTVTFMNIAKEPLAISNASVQGSSGAATLVSLEPRTIAQGEAALAVLRFQPVALGWSEASLHIVSSDPRRPELNVAVVGLATDGTSTVDAGAGPRTTRASRSPMIPPAAIAAGRS